MMRPVRGPASALFHVLALIAAIALSIAVPARATDDDVQAPSAAAASNAEKLFGAIVKVTTRSVPDARSNDSLGDEREGTGVVIGPDGLVLTIGYLVVEADEIKITDARGREYPANVVANDQSSGFAIVRTAVPIDATPIAFGDSATTTDHEPVMIASAGGEGPSFAFIVSKRPFTGNWEYKLDYALFTSPPTSDWSGAALIDRDGKLLGIGSLIVREATEGETRLPGNVFVPIDLLKPILGDLVKQGRRAGPVRPWLGISADELQGHLFVTKVSPEGPADRAGSSRATSFSPSGPTSCARRTSSTSACGRAARPATKCRSRC